MNLEKVNENPSITISSRDYDQLERIAMAGIRTRRHAYVARFLADELERAAVLPLQQMSEKVVKIYSDVNSVTTRRASSDALRWSIPGRTMLRSLYFSADADLGGVDRPVRGANDGVPRLRNRIA